MFFNFSTLFLHGYQSFLRRVFTGFDIYFILLLSSFVLTRFFSNRLYHTIPLPFLVNFIFGRLVFVLFAPFADLSGTSASSSSGFASSTGFLSFRLAVVQLWYCHSLNFFCWFLIFRLASIVSRGSPSLSSIWSQYIKILFIKIKYFLVLGLNQRILRRLSRYFRLRKDWH